MARLAQARDCEIVLASLPAFVANGEPSCAFFGIAEESDAQV
jgi:hypothetical protein